MVFVFDSEKAKEVGVIGAIIYDYIQRSNSAFTFNELRKELDFMRPGEIAQGLNRLIDKGYIENSFRTENPFDNIIFDLK
jgi:DNA-binding HxlR family transcriptional regulator